MGLGLSMAGINVVRLQHPHSTPTAPAPHGLHRLLSMHWSSVHHPSVHLMAGGCKW